MFWASLCRNKRHPTKYLTGEMKGDALSPLQDLLV